MIQEPLFPGTLAAVTTSDSTVYSPAVRQLYIGTGGDVAVVDVNGNTVTFKNVPDAGVIGPFFVSKVKATGTTATNIVAFI